MTVTVAEPKIRVPYVIARSGEIVNQHPRFVSKLGGGLRLAYDRPRPNDWAHGVLRVRVRTTREGQPQWRLLNTRRQWECMEKNLCQVCGEVATDPVSGRIPWIMTETAFRDVPGEPGNGYTSAPATCRACIGDALALCPRLHISSAVCTVAYAEPVAVLAEVFQPGPGRRAVHTGEHNVFVRLDDEVLLPRVLATQLIVKVHDLQPAPLLA
ncbi:hypothetical protein [Planomonospora sp. ID82291]|uniref:hypothetical protein n=1 Tax=Planomonospora sp. ID82291 TaxID=2738136 RepID=UPI0018C365F1|nr:hypothetical protein [Planomonospora sp. ID82291]MBG0818607.1 hypothetical protein [Planomonospora sp. ID82291]